jgi:surface antigen
MSLKQASYFLLCFTAFHSIPIMDALISILAYINVALLTQSLGQGYCRRRGETNLFTLKKQSVWQFIQGQHIFRITASHVVVMTTLIAVVLTYAFGSPLFSASAQANCATSDTPYSVVAGDTLSNIANRNQTTWQELSQHNHIANANEIQAGQTICLPDKTLVHGTDQHSQPIQLPAHVTDARTVSMVTKTAPIIGTGNYFPYGQCTWWANQRYYQLHGVYVPWTTNSDAWRWTSQAQNFHWSVSSKPTVGSIVDLQPWVQGSYELGHVAIVEQILPDGHVIASNMNWGGNHSVVSVNFAPGAGITFIHT